MQKKVLLLLANGFEELEAAAFTDIFGWSRSDGLEGVSLTAAAIHETIKGTWNLTVVPELVIQEPAQAEGFDALAIPGGFEEAGYYEDAYSPLFQEVIKGFNDQEKPIAGICVAALPIARSGALKDRRGTTYYLKESKRINQLAAFGVKTEKTDVVADGNIITSCGPSTATEVAFKLLEELTSRENRKSVEAAMGFDTDK